VMGAAYDPTADPSPGDRAGPSLAATFAVGRGGTGPYDFTWAEAQAAMATGTLRPLRSIPASESDTGIADPAHNVAPTPDFTRICANTGIDDSARCIGAVLDAVNHAHALEGIGPMVLPSGFGELSVPQQLLVAIDLERVDRHLSPFAGLTAALDANAQRGADAANDPPDPGRRYLLDDAEWAGGSSNGLDAVYGWMYDVVNPSNQAIVGKVYRGTPNDAQVRKFAHMFADEIISQLAGGLPGIAGTQIAFIRGNVGAKELWVMDYDGANQHKLTSLGSVSLTPHWSPDSSRIAFTCFQPVSGVMSAQICMYSLDLGKTVSFARFRGTNNSPTWSPDGSQVMFSSSMQGGDPALYASDPSGNRPKRLTFNSRGADTSPAWNPKTGQLVAFVSDRGGTPQLYLMNSDGTNTQKLDLPDMGYVIDPAWSPNGQLLAFSWRRPSGNYDIYIMDAASRQIRELTRDQGRNERPSWAPDGRHLVFESTRGGSRQIWTMLADGSQPHQLTNSGHNESPNWSTR